MFNQSDSIFILKYLYTHLHKLSFWVCFRQCLKANDAANESSVDLQCRPMGLRTWM